MYLYFKIYLQMLRSIHLNDKNSNPNTWNFENFMSRWYKKLAEPGADKPSRVTEGKGKVGHQILQANIVPHFLLPLSTERVKSTKNPLLLYNTLIYFCD